MSTNRKRLEHSNGSGLTLAQYAEAKRLPIDFLRGLGLADMSYMGHPAVRIPYRNKEGVEAAVQFRKRLEKGDDADDRFAFRKGDRTCLYGLWRLASASKAGHVAIVEGPSDSHTVWLHDIPAVGLPGAANWNDERDAAHLDGIPIIYVIVEPDRGGKAVRDWLAKSSIRTRVRLVQLGDFKDPSELHCDAPERFLERWQAALDASVPWADVAQQQTDAEKAAAYALAKDLLHDPALLNHIGEGMAARGYAGALRPPKLGYVAMSSRLLERPLNLAFIAQSAAGKNRAVDAAKELMPPEALYVEGAGSARALVYTAESFEHRVVIVAEADSIPEDGPAASAVRSLAAENAMAYDVVERDEKTGRHATRHIVKQGPTGLITTATRSLGDQMSTRMLEVLIPDDEKQTRAVLHAHADSVMSRRGADLDLAPLVAVQRYLAVSGLRQVEVPFADVLAALVPATAVRMRRDFRQLLTCVQAVALLYQCQRQTRDGWVQATLDDYALARDLLEAVFDTIAAEGVSPVIRQTVEAVGPAEEVTAAELAKRLSIAKSTASYRVGRALHGGWLTNRETRPGHAKRLARGAPLPEQTTALPTPERVREVFERSNDSGEVETPPPPTAPGEGDTGGDGDELEHVGAGEWTR